MKKLIRSDAFKCCHGCSKRSLGCHSRCEEYKAARIAWDRLRERMRQDKLVVRGEPNGHKTAGGFSS